MYRGNYETDKRAKLQNEANGFRLLCVVEGIERQEIASNEVAKNALASFGFVWGVFHDMSAFAR